MRAVSFGVADRPKKRISTVAFAYLASCAFGAGGMFGYLVLWLDRNPSSHSLLISAATGVAGGIVSLPVALPLMIASERWSWRNPLIYLVVAAPVYVAALLAGLAAFVGLSRLDLLPLNPAHVFHTLALQGYLIATMAAVAAYWLLRGRHAGAGV